MSHQAKYSRYVSLDAVQYHNCSIGSEPRAESIPRCKSPTPPSTADVSMEQQQTLKAYRGMPTAERPQSPHGGPQHPLERRSPSSFNSSKNQDARQTTTTSMDRSNATAALSALDESIHDLQETIPTGDERAIQALCQKIDILSEVVYRHEITLRDSGSKRRRESTLLSEDSEQRYGEEEDQEGDEEEDSPIPERPYSPTPPENRRGFKQQSSTTNTPASSRSSAVSRTQDELEQQAMGAEEQAQLVSSILSRVEAVQTMMHQSGMVGGATPASRKSSARRHRHEDPSAITAASSTSLRRRPSSQSAGENESMSIHAMHQVGKALEIVTEQLERQSALLETVLLTQQEMVLQSEQQHRSTMMLQHQQQQQQAASPLPDTQAAGGFAVRYADAYDSSLDAMDQQQQQLRVPHSSPAAAAHVSATRASRSADRQQFDESYDVTASAATNVSRQELLQYARENTSSHRNNASVGSPTLGYSNPRYHEPQGQSASSIKRYTPLMNQTEEEQNTSVQSHISADEASPARFRNSNPTSATRPTAAPFQNYTNNSRSTNSSSRSHISVDEASPARYRDVRGFTPGRSSTGSSSRSHISADEASPARRRLSPDVEEDEQERLDYTPRSQRTGTTDSSVARSHISANEASPARSRPRPVATLQDEDDEDVQEEAEQNNFYHHQANHRTAPRSVNSSSLMFETEPPKYSEQPHFLIRSALKKEGSTVKKLPTDRALFGGAGGNSARRTTSQYRSEERRLFSENPRDDDDSSASSHSSQHTAPYEASAPRSHRSPTSFTNTNNTSRKSPYAVNPDLSEDVVRQLLIENASLKSQLGQQLKRNDELILKQMEAAPSPRRGYGEFAC